MMRSPDLIRVVELKTEDTTEVQAFLSVRPVHTVVMSSFIVDNGVESELNRGKFYGYRHSVGNLEGVALIGHSTLFEARTDEAVKAFAFRARISETPIHQIMSAGDAADRFWTYYRPATAARRLRCEELLFEASFPFLVRECERNLGTADASQINGRSNSPKEFRCVLNFVKYRSLRQFRNKPLGIGLRGFEQVVVIERQISKPERFPDGLCKRALAALSRPMKQYSRRVTKGLSQLIRRKSRIYQLIHHTRPIVSPMCG